MTMWIWGWCTRQHWGPDAVLQLLKQLALFISQGDYLPLSGSSLAGIYPHLGSHLQPLLPCEADHAGLLVVFGSLVG